MEDDSLTRWRQQLKINGKKHWLIFYNHFMGQNVSNIPRFYRALNMYGDSIMFDAIIDSSWRELTGDSINYVLKVASEKWKEQQAEIDEEDEYKTSIHKAKEISLEKNLALEKKLKKGTK